MVKLAAVTRRYSGVLALDGVSVEIADREFVAVTGPSGCGKSTLLNILGGLDRPDSGEVFVDGIALHAAGDDALTDYRRRRLGIVFQFFNLLPAMSVVENVELPLLFAGVPRRQMRARALAALDLVGLAARADHLPHQLSGGEMQRAAVARALVHEPALLLADEPTGNLDTANADRLMKVLAKIASQSLTTMVVVTHSEAVAALASRRIHMLDGKISHG
ncbi:MAG: ABC transporter ATP-binding protein [Terrimicrobiaceae bacterium]|nr:ABC transporter ATP-binding protein [Terrimicrobiaceae bacterium]